MAFEPIITITLKLKCLTLILREAIDNHLIISRFSIRIHKRNFTFNGRFSQTFKINFDEANVEHKILDLSE